MTPIVRLVNGGDLCETLFVPLERIPVVLADVHRALPQLKKELRKKWAVEYVEIENKISRRKNPFRDRNRCLYQAGGHVRCGSR